MSAAVWISATDLEFVQVVIEISTRRRLNLPKKNREMLNHLFPHHIHTDLKKKGKSSFWEFKFINSMLDFLIHRFFPYQGIKNIGSFN